MESFSRIDDCNNNSKNLNSENISVTNVIVDNPTQVTKPERKIVYYGDGPVEEFEEEIESKRQDENESIDYKTPQSWPAYILSVIDSIGERLAFMLGITSPKYYYQIQEYHRQQKEIEEDKEFEMREKKAWSENKEKFKKNRDKKSSDRVDAPVEEDDNIAVISDNIVLDFNNVAYDNTINDESAANQNVPNSQDIPIYLDNANKY